MQLHRQRLTIAIPIFVCAGFVLALFLSLGYLSTPAQAAGNVLYVSDGASACISLTPPSWCSNPRYPDIQSAVDDAAPGDEIRVENLAYSGVVSRSAPAGYAGTAFVTQTVFITKNLTIRGGYTENDFTSGSSPSARTTIYPGGVGRGFFVTGADVTLQNFEVTTASAAGLGGSDAPADAGGGIYVFNGSVTIDNSDIHNNVAARGAGVYAHASDVGLVGTTVRTHSGATHGAGIYIDAGTATFSASTVRNNAASEAGGGLYATSAAITATLGTIHSNSANTGAGIYANGGRLTLSSVTIDQNKAGSNGGGIYLNDSQTTIHANSWLTSNQAAAGAGIYADTGTLTIGSTTFDANVATSNGGGLYLSGAQASLDDNTQITSNEANGDGGGVYVTAGATLGSDSTTLTINQNTASSGGGAYVAGSSATFDALALSSNTSARIGGGAVVTDSGVLTITNGTVSTNEAPAGGGLYAGGAGTLIVNDTTVSNHTNSDNGAGVYAHNAAVTFDSMTIQDNTATTAGAGLYLDSGSTLTAATLDVYRNTAGSDRGGGLFAAGATATISGLSLQENSADSGGAGIYAANSIITATNNGAWSDNSVATGDGGALYADAGTTVHLSGGTIEQNTADHGAGVYIVTATASLSNTTLTNHSTDGDGAALYARNSRLDIAGNSEVSNNTVASGAGGGLYLDTVTGTVASTLMEHNSARRGGGIYAIGGDVTISDTTVHTNTARIDGGGLYVAATRSRIERSRITQNLSDRGGGLFLGGNSATLSENTVAENTTTLRRTTLFNKPIGIGAGVYISGTTVAMSDNEILTNTIPYRSKTEVVGQVTETIVITQTGPDPADWIIIEEGPITETRTTADNGAGVYMLKGTGVFTGNVFRGNDASLHGGGMFLGGSDVRLVNNLLIRNSIGVSNALGSAIYVSSTKISLVHNTIADNIHRNLDGSGTNSALQLAGAGNMLSMTNNIIAHHDIGVNASDGNSGAGTANLWWDNSIRNWTRDLFGQTTVHYFGDPSFVGPNDYHIAADSAAVDAGADAGIAADIAGTPRPRGFAPDVGAYEHQYSHGVYLDQSATPLSVGQGDTLTHVITVVNHSVPPVNNLQVNVTLPAEQQLLSSSIDRGACSGLTCDVTSLAQNESAHITLDLEVNGTPQAGTVVPMTTTVDVTFDGIDPTDTDTSDAFATYLQEVFDPTNPPGGGGGPVYTGACRINLNGTDYDSMQAAIAQASRPSDVIKVSGYCADTILLNNPTLPEVTIQGGWSTDLTAHDPDIYTATLDALGRAPVVSIIGESLAPVVEDLTLVNGNNVVGGGVYVQDAGATLRNLHVTNSTASNYGGGIYIDSGVSTIEDSRLEGNSAGIGGGGIYLLESGTQVKNTDFVNNSGATDGGAAYLKKSGATIANSLISGHSVSGLGGGIYLDESPASIQKNEIRDNSASAGGGIFADSSPATLSQNEIRNNAATSSPSFVLIWPQSPGGGGGIYGEQSDLRIMNNTILGNTAPSDAGAGIHLWDARQPQIDGNVIADNTGGHGVYLRLTPAVFKVWILIPPIKPPPFGEELILPIEQPPPVRMRHNTIARNSGDGLHVFGETTVELENNIIWENSGTGVAIEEEVFPHIIGVVIAVPPGVPVPLPVPVPTFYPPKVTMARTLWGNDAPSTSSSGAFSSLSQTQDYSGGSCQNWTFGAAPDCDPAFQDPDNGDYHIKRISPAFQLAKSLDVSKDVDGEDRIQGNLPDLGADEYTFRRVRYATPNSTHDGAGDRCLNYANPCTLQAAIDKAVDGDLIKVAGKAPTTGNASYTTVFARNGQSQVAYVDKTITIQGGYCPAFTPMSGPMDCDWETPDPDTYPSIIDPSGAGRGIYVSGDVSPEIIGLRVINGDASAAGMDGRGGGIYVISATATISNVDVFTNTAVTGGGVYLDASTATVQNSLLRGNDATQGGGIALHAGEATVQGSTITTNTADDGAGIFVDGSKGTVISNTVTDNTASNGAGVYVIGGEAEISHNDVSGNSATAGGGVYVASSAAQILANDVSGNSATTGGGIYMDATAARVAGNTVGSNNATSGAGFFLDAVLDGIVEANTVEDNTASGDGGGLYLRSSTGLITKNTVAGNSGSNGGGLYLASFSGATLEKNTIATNDAGTYGGGVYMKLSDATLNENTVMTNTAGSGAGIYSKLSANTIVSNTVRANTATLFAGGLYLDESNTSIKDSAIEDNNALSAGGVYLLRSSNAKFEDSTIDGNSASNNGGGVYLQLSDSTLSRLQLTGNTAGSNGGAVYLSTSVATLEQMILRNNSALKGGSVYLYSGSDATMTNHVIAETQADDAVHVAGSAPTLKQTTFARNSNTGLYAAGDSTVSLINTIMVSHTLGLYVESGSTATMNTTLWHDNQLDWNGPGTIDLGDTNLTGDPNFEPDGYHLSTTSPALNEGVNAGVAVDVDGDHRPQGGAPDLGADELPTDCFVRVSSDMNTTYTVVQDAIDAASAGDEVRIAGKCLGVRTRGGRQQAAYIDKSITLTGGYTPTNWSASYPLTQTTIIDAQNQGRVLYVTGSATPVVRGLTLTGGSAGGLGGGPNGLDAGGAVYIGGTTATISQTKVTNSNAYYGGGIYLQSSATQLITTTVSDNSGTKGGGLFLRSSDAAIKRSKVSGNSASGEGGGLFISFGTPALTDTVISGNTAASGGGGLFIESSDAVIRDGSIAGNSANAGGGAYLDNSAATITHNTIEGNQAENAGGVYFANSDASLSANVLATNSANNNGGAVYAEASDAEIVNNVVATNQAGTSGSAGYVLSAAPRILHNTLVDNSGGDGTGLSIAHAGAITSDATVTNNIFSGHTTAIAVTAGDRATVKGTLWNENGTTLAGAGTIITDTTNFAADPDFVKPGAGDYRLQRTSSAIDAGVNSGVSADIEGHPRPIDRGYDIGADEYYNPELVALNSATPKPAVANTQLTYSFRVANVGNVPLTATITATLPFNATPTGVMTWTQVAIPIDGTWERSIVVTVNPDYDGTLVSELTASAVQGTAGSATETVDVVPSDPGLDAVQSTQPTIAERGEPLRYNVRVVNTGNIPLNTTITATLPAQVTPNDPVVWKETIPSGSNVLHPVDVQVPADATGDLISRVDVTTQQGLTATNTITTPLAASALALNLVGRPSPVAMGAPLTYTLVVTNTGNVATDVFITDTLPAQVSPAGAQHWSTTLSQNASWTEEVVTTAPSWYLGPMTNVLRATTADGAVGVVTDTTETVLNTLVPTIRSTGSGTWNEPTIWDENRVPNDTDIVLVQSGHDLTLPASIAVTSLINRGTLTDAAGCQTTTLAVSDQLRNYGQILGTDGGPEAAGCSLMLQLTTLINEGDIIAGNGGDVVETGPGAAGAGGEVFVIAGADGPGQVANTGLIRGGDAGHPNPDATAPQDGAPGGDVIISATPMLSLAGGQIIAGQGSDGIAGGTNGERGEIIINGGDGAAIDLDDPNTQISGGDVSIYAGDGAKIQLDGTIDAEGDATVAVGAGGTVGGDAGNNVNVETDRILYKVRIVGPARVRTSPANGVAVPLTLLNLSPKDATYEMDFANAAGWTERHLPATVAIPGAGLAEITPILAAPADAQVDQVDMLSITAARSGGTAGDTLSIEGIVGPPLVYLPLIVR